MRVLFAGDFCPQHRVAELFEREDYKVVLGEIKPVIEKTDYSIVNFECPVTKGDEIPINKKGPNLKCSVKGIEAVKWACFDCVTLANNHFLDYGFAGVDATLSACRNLGIDHVGGGKDLLEASKILYKKIGEENLAIINCCEHEFSIATESSAGSNPLNPIHQFYAIKEAKTNADYVVVVVHGGHEHYQYPSPRMQETYRFFVEAGADVVINHHQHCFSGYEVYKSKPIFYGLGNFCFDEKDVWYSNWNLGYFVEVNLTKCEITFQLIPYHQCDDQPKVRLLNKKFFDSKLQAINDIIADPQKLKIKTDEYYSSCMNSYSTILEPSNNRYYLALKHRGWLPSFISKKRKLAASNFIYCESHRDKLIYYLLH